MFKVQIICFIDKEVVKEISCSTLSRAQKTESGMAINLNHEEFFTSIINAESGEEV